MDNKKYIERIKNLREDHDYTQEYVANYLGTSQTMYARYERGANELPIRHLLSLCKLYHVSSDYILGPSNKLSVLVLNRQSVFNFSKYMY